LGKGDEVVLLLFYNENKRTDRQGQSSWWWKKKVAALPIDGFELRGIVTDETKTKVGKDFYDLYYYKYNEYKINSSMIVSISENFVLQETLN
jgi:hypothetical protein